jgi:hypothetical protein
MVGRHMRYTGGRDCDALEDSAERDIGNDEPLDLSQRLRRIANELRHLSETDPDYSERMRIAQEELHAVSLRLRLRRFN